MSERWFIPAGLLSLSTRTLLISLCHARLDVGGGWGARGRARGAPGGGRARGVASRAPGMAPGSRGCRGACVKS